ncbi:serine/threonine-protein kinase [Bacillus pakistanensis]|uniref:non-specific serine/threonine protein kinase n=1 Tax=Rossellomorea pakistanensis TaxID=992288 RepID=A0ABS2NG05_9BACI|nr:Stk1 family PASTA domain-containing Ser/Thr kinase [Bacillus pakistanensis]MBM7586786.1 serine/threonine-protein kinase [Bacillus pakistanensis]
MLKGKRLSGRYKILDMVGGGGMANVYLAQDMILDREVAIKMLRLDFANEEEFIKRFQREAQSATSLAHPNIVSIFDVGEEDDLYYIVMEYVDGMTLKQYIQQHSPVSVEKVLDIMTQITSAISHAHQNHIIHRDIKPQNILIDNHGNVKITDFGIAMALSATSITQTNSVLGSVHYLSPEQARGGMATKKSDIYSLGIVMFELLTGRLPFSGESAVSIALKHLQSETPSLRRWNPNIPQSVENIVLKATAKDPFRRYDAVEEVEEELFTALNPDRIDEPKFSVPEDDDATKAIPVITNDRPYSNMDNTIVHDKNTNEKQTVPNPDAKEEKKKKKKRKWPAIIISAFFLIAILGVLAVTVLPELMGPKEVNVPDVSGEELEEAVRELKDVGFKIDKEIEQHSDEVPEGYVIKTNPKAGSKIKEGKSINLYISSGKEPFKLGNYEGRPVDDVQSLLEEKGFKEIKIEKVYSDATQDEVVKQNPEAGEEVIPEDTVLTLSVSQGQETFELRDLKGYNEKNLDVYGESTGLEIVKVEEFSNEVPEGVVISQLTDPGTPMLVGDSVTVIVSKGKEPSPPQTVTEEISVPYEPKEEGKPQTVEIYVEDNDSTYSEPVISESITATKNYSIDLLIEQGKTGKYKVVRDGTVFFENEVPYPGEE